MKKFLVAVGAFLTLGSALAQYNFDGFKWNISSDKFVKEIDKTKYKFVRSYDYAYAKIYDYRGNFLNYKALFNFHFDINNTLQRVKIIVENPKDNPKDNCEAFYAIYKSLRDKHGAANFEKQNDKFLRDSSKNSNADNKNLCLRHSKEPKKYSVLDYISWGSSTTGDPLIKITTRNANVDINYYGPLWLKEKVRRESLVLPLVD